MARPSRRQLTSWLRSRAGHAVVAALALGVVGYVIAYPLAVVRYPPMTDLPFHAASTSILRHYFDPAFGFREQFGIHLLEVPYVSMYLLGALFALVLPISVAVKVSAAVMLALLPAGLAVLFAGMKKTPLWGLLGLGLVWTNLTHWGFLNFMGAIGLYAMSLGLTLMVVDRPTRRRQLALALCLLAVFFTHVYRYPFAILSCVGVGVFMWPATRRFLPLVWPLVPSLTVFGAWQWVRSDAIGGPTPKLALHPNRMAELPDHVVSGFVGPVGQQEQALFAAAVGALWVVALTALVWFFWFGRHRRRSGREVWWGAGVTLLPLIFAGAYLLTYLVLPMEIGLWWYVYPREATTAIYIALAAVPDMPRQWWLRLPLVVVVGVATGRVGFLVAEQYFAFAQQTRDFEAVVAHIPQRPKLSYLVFDHDGSFRRTTPFIHLPAWVQAEKGGTLSFHFVAWHHSPIRYREGSPHVPPPTPLRWEWTPQRFRVQQHGAFFDEFLVRRHSDPSALFASDPSVRLVVNEGAWWLFRRQARSEPQD